MRRRRAIGVKRRARPVQHEHREQVEVCRWLRSEKLLHCSIPNEGKRSERVAMMLTAAGMSKGAPDLLIFERPPSAPHLVGVAIQMKRIKGDKPPPEQEKWLADLHARGWASATCYGATEALDWLASLGFRVPRSTP